MQRNQFDLSKIARIGEGDTLCLNMLNLLVLTSVSTLEAALFYGNGSRMHLSCCYCWASLKNGSWALLPGKWLWKVHRCIGRVQCAISENSFNRWLRRIQEFVSLTKSDLQSEVTIVSHQVFPCERNTSIHWITLQMRGAGCQTVSHCSNYGVTCAAC